MKKLVLTLITTFFILSLFAQENIIDTEKQEINQNPREVRPFGISLGGAYFITAESGIAFLSIDYFIIPQFSLEANIGITDFEAGYFAVGGKGYLNSNTSQSGFAPFVGALIGYEFYEYMVQIPLGLDYVSKKGFNVSLSFNQLFYFDSYKGTFIDLKIGWRFKK